jgi:sugar transferase (PEP-CTERM/EpsH1 system associated)
MANILFLVHRLPYPPDKGDKVRSYHLLKHLSSIHQVFLGTFLDDPADAIHIPRVRALCSELYVARIRPKLAKLRSLAGLAKGAPLSVGYYKNADFQNWVNATISHNAIDAVVIFSSVMAQFVVDVFPLNSLPLLVDFVDVDSDKWTQYAGRHRWPLSWLYRREGALLLAYERRIAMRTKRSFFVTDAEVALFEKLAPECAPVLESLSNGVDAEYFSPEAARPSPFPLAAPGLHARNLVFTGAMDYWPNIDAVIWFVQQVLTPLRQAWPGLTFYIVGRNPPLSVQSLACDGVVVTGSVPDVRPYLQHATLVVAPLRVARGIQNKILEAMAMARPVVASSACVNVIDARRGIELCAATSSEDFLKVIHSLLSSPELAREIGQAGRIRILSRYSWEAHLAGIDHHLSSEGVV